MYSSTGIINKICSFCKEEKDIDNFYLTIKSGKPYRRANCIKCEKKVRTERLFSKKPNIINLPNEIWHNIDNKYKISTENRIKREVYPNVFELCPIYIGANGYYYVSMRNKKSTCKLLHRIIGEVFIPNPMNYATINHKNGIKTDNRVGNLEWCSYAYNNKHAKDTGLNKGCRGENIWKSKLKNEQVLDIFNSNKSGVSLSKKYNVVNATISAIKTGKRWSHITNKKYIVATHSTIITFNELSKNIGEWSNYFNINHATLSERLRKGQSFENIFNFYKIKNQCRIHQ